MAIVRVTVGLISKSMDALDELMTDTGLNRTDVINRALRVYNNFNKKIEDDRYEFILRDKETDKEYIVVIF